MKTRSVMLAGMAWAAAASFGAFSARAEPARAAFNGGSAVPTETDAIATTPQDGAVATPVAAPATLVTIRRDTPVELMAYAEVTTARAKPGTRFRLVLNQPITVAGNVVVAKGASAFGEVISAKESGGLGHSGRMAARLLYLQAGDAEIPLDGQTSAKGTGAGSAGVAVLFTGIVGLFHRGNNAKIKAGEILAGFVAEDVTLDIGVSPVRRVTGQAAVPSAAG